MSARAQNACERFLPSGDFSLAVRDGVMGVLVSEHSQRAVLAALMDNSLMRGPIATLSLGDLVGSQDRVIYALMLELSGEDEEFDLTTIAQALEDRGELQQAGAFPYIASLIEEAVVCKTPRTRGKVAE